MNRPRQTWVHWHVDGEVCHNCALAFHWDIENGGTPSYSNTAQIAPFHSRRGTPCSTQHLCHIDLYYMNDLWPSREMLAHGGYMYRVLLKLAEMLPHKAAVERSWVLYQPARKPPQDVLPRALGSKISYIYFLDPECCFLHSWCFIMSLLMITK
jgi:hypothetical protein